MIIVEEPVSDIIAEIRSHLFAEESLDLESNVFSEDLGNFGDLHKFAEAVFIFYTLVVEISSPNPCKLQSSPQHVFNLGYKEVQRCSEVSLVTSKQSFSPKSFAPIGNYWGPSCKRDEIPLLYSMLHGDNFKRRPYHSLDHKRCLHAVVPDHFCPDGGLVVLCLESSLSLGNYASIS